MARSRVARSSSEVLGGSACSCCRSEVISAPSLSIFPFCGSYFFWRSAKARWPSLVATTACWKAMMAIFAGTAWGTTAVGAVAAGAVARAAGAAEVAVWAKRPGAARVAASARLRGRERFMRGVELLTASVGRGYGRTARCLSQPDGGRPACPRATQRVPRQPGRTRRTGPLGRGRKLHVWLHQLYRAETPQSQTTAGSPEKRRWAAAVLPILERRSKGLQGVLRVLQERRDKARSWFGTALA